MKHPSSLRPRLAACVGAVLLGMLVAAGSALGIAAPAGLSSAPAGASNAASWTFSWDPVGADDGFTFLRYEGDVLPDVGAPVHPFSTTLPTTTIVNPQEGPATFRVRAVQVDGLGVEAPSGYAEIRIRPDRSAPGGTVELQGPLANGWYRAPLQLIVTCTDPGGAISACPTPPNWTEQGAFAAAARSVDVTDDVGNPGSIPLPAFNFDSVAPDPGLPSEPSRLVGQEPAFAWIPGADTGSLVDEYILQFQTPAQATADPPTWTNFARVPHVEGTVNYTARRQPAVREEPLPERVELRWRVRTVDRAGNAANSTGRDLYIDPTVPPAPTITGGPAAPTRNSSPTFTWAGGQPSFLWDVTVAGTQNPVRSGGGAASQATAQNLPDGAYTFRVSQVTEAGRESASATRAFVVDTVPPDAPQILTRPTFPSITAPVFTWRTEPGALSRWALLNGVGTPIAGPTDSPVASAKLDENLAHGSYTFQVWQIDAAGNISAPTVEPFTVLAPLVTPPPPSGTAALIAIMPRQYAKRLSPKAGRVLPTRSPVLRWSRGPRGTRLYNLQVFRVTKVRGRKTPKVTKVLSRFPKARQYRAPRKVLRPNTCYVWRVWPYTGRAFTPKPVGVSNFCIATAKVVKKAEAKAMARKRALARKKAAARQRAATKAAALRRAGAVKR